MYPGQMRTIGGPLGTRSTTSGGGRGAGPKEISARFREGRNYNALKSRRTLPRCGELIDATLIAKMPGNR